MPFIETELQGAFIFEPRVFADERGYFFESYNQKTFADAGISCQFVQDNQARSTKGVLRGLHYQTGEAAQAKLVRVTEGTVLDVIVDLRQKSSTYGKWIGVELSAENKRQLFVPRGFAHGYIVLSPTAEFFYKCDNFYSKSHEGGLIYNDPTLNIDWQLPENEFVISDKDKVLPVFGQHLAAD